MNPDLVDSPRRSNRWWILVALVFAGQLGLIYWLGARPPVITPKTKPVPLVYVLRDGVEPPPGGLNPILLALPNPDGFSGSVWLRLPVPRHESEDWTEPPRFLAPETNQLGRALVQLAANDFTHPIELPPRPEPMGTMLTVLPPDAGPVGSMVTLVGGLTNRTIITPIKLNAWNSPTILSDTVVGMAIDGFGRVTYPPSLDSESGSAEADAFALGQANRLRFQPLPGAGGATSLPLTWGKLVFHWQTLPPLATNTSPEGVK